MVITMDSADVSRSSMMTAEVESLLYLFVKPKYFV